MYNSSYWSLSNLNDDVYKKRGKRVVEVFRHHYDNDEVNRISLSRTKRRIKEICLCNDFEWFVTMTVSSKIQEYNRFDLENCVDNVKKLMKKIQRKSVDFKYIYIQEKHDNGAYHFHGLMKGLPKDDIYINSNGYYSSHIIDNLGFNSFSKIVDYNKTCNYIMKYITKDCCRTDNNQIYFCSRGLKKPSTEFMIDKDLSKIFDKFYENEYCQIKDFDISRLSDKQKRELNAYFKENDEYFMNDNNYITNWLQLFTNFSRYGKLKLH